MSRNLKGLPTEHLKLPHVPKPKETLHPGVTPDTQDVRKLSRPSYHRHAEEQPLQPMGGRPSATGPVHDPVKNKSKKKASASDSLSKYLNPFGG